MYSAFTEMTAAITTIQTEKAEVITESYEDWKERMLRMAYEKLAVLERQGQ